MEKKRIAFHTLGCKTNQYETDGLIKLFTNAGFEHVPFKEKADIYLINTCTVTAEADRKSRQMLRQARQRNKAAVIVATGCQTVLGDSAKWADLVVDSHHKSGAVQAVQAFIAGQEQEDTPGQELCFDEIGLVDSQSETRAYLKIEDGCDQYCSYCIIPFARGPVRSRSEASIMAEARALANAGYKELVLTGIHLCSYGSDRGLPGHAVMELALELAKIKGVERIRLGSLEPRFVTGEFIRLAGANPRLCPHFHLSLQSGSDKTLRLMRRRYDTADFARAVNGLRQAFPEPAITTDLIVGFPQETEEDFADSLSFCREMAFARMHVFRYSPRQGTTAARMTGQVGSEQLARRSREMISLAEEMALAYHQAHLGRELPVLVEKIREDGLYEGLSPNYLTIRFRSGSLLETGQIYSVFLEQAQPDFILGAKTCS